MVRPEQPTTNPPTVERTIRVAVDVTSDSIIRVLAALAGIWLVVHLRLTLTVVILALMIVAVFSPPLREAQQRFGRRIALSLFVYVAGLALLAWLVLPTLTEQTVAVLENAPCYAAHIQDVLNAHHVNLNLARPVADFSRLSGQASSWFTVAENLFSGIYGLAAVLVLSLYLLVDADSLGLGLLGLLPREHRLEVRRLGEKLVGQVGGYIRGQLVLSALIGVTSGLVLTLVNVPAALALATLTAVADAIPVVGIWMAGVTSSLLALAQAPWEAAVVAGFFFCYHLVEVNLLMPRVYRGTLGLSFSIVIISFLAGIEVLGILGACLRNAICYLILRLDRLRRSPSRHGRRSPSGLAASREP